MKSNVIFTRISFLVFLVFISAMPIYAQNATPGDNSGPDNTAYLFAPFRFEANRGEDNYILRVGDQDNLFGQRYSVVDKREIGLPDTTMPTECNLVQFYDIVNNSTSDLGVFLITGHGNSDCLGVEAYELSSVGDSICNEQASKYCYGTVDPSVPPLRWITDFYPT
ncbi:MAG: hypothetical protein GF315_07020 [candidate division Zixibacteria bacterium]|nr:hypothetical protein [candidate division Zixibacteria bacterium]